MERDHGDPLRQFGSSKEGVLALMHQIAQTDDKSLTISDRLNGHKLVAKEHLREMLRSKAWALMKCLVHFFPQATEQHKQICQNWFEKLEVYSASSLILQTTWSSPLAIITKNMSMSYWVGLQGGILKILITENDPEEYTISKQLPSLLQYYVGPASPHLVWLIENILTHQKPAAINRILTDCGIGVEAQDIQAANALTNIGFTSPPEMAQYPMSSAAVQQSYQPMQTQYYQLSYQPSRELKRQKGKDWAAQQKSTKRWTPYGEWNASEDNVKHESTSAPRLKTLQNIGHEIDFLPQAAPNNNYHQSYGNIKQDKSYLSSSSIRHGVQGTNRAVQGHSLFTSIDAVNGNSRGNVSGPSFARLQQDADGLKASLPPFSAPATMSSSNNIAGGVSSSVATPSSVQKPGKVDASVLQISRSPCNDISNANGYVKHKTPEDKHQAEKQITTKLAATPQMTPANIEDRDESDEDIRPPQAIRRQRGGGRLRRGLRGDIKEKDEDSDSEREDHVRCFCGQDKDLGPNDPKGDMICCEECHAWQHVVCMGLEIDVNNPKYKYFCEKCRPRKSEHRETVSAIKEGIGLNLLDIRLTDHYERQEKKSRGKRKSRGPLVFRTVDDDED